MSDIRNRLFPYLITVKQPRSIKHGQYRLPRSCNAPATCCCLDLTISIGYAALELRSGQCLLCLICNLLRTTSNRWCVRNTEACNPTVTATVAVSIRSTAAVAVSDMQACLSTALSGCLVQELKSAFS
jgi:hypothetical protein